MWFASRVTAGRRLPLAPWPVVVSRPRVRLVVWRVLLFLFRLLLAHFTLSLSLELSDNLIFFVFLLVVASHSYIRTSLRFSVCSLSMMTRTST
jgi:hypothetical protein